MYINFMIILFFGESIVENISQENLNVMTF